jgi:hypothetical protein
MSNLCRLLHEQIEQQPLIRYPFKLHRLPRNGIYFFYEDGEIWGHGGNKPRIVRVGTHRDGNFRSRIAEHYLLSESKMKFDEDKAKPSDRSIFRKNIGRALLNRRGDSYLSIWEIDYMYRKKRALFRHLRDIKREKKVESEITEILRNNFSFRYIKIERQKERMGKSGLESRLVGTIARCRLCEPSKNWLGNHSPKEKIRMSGLWLVQHLGADEIDGDDEKTISEAIGVHDQVRM